MVTAGLLRRDPHRTVALPLLRHHIGREPHQQIRGQSGLFQSEGMIAAGNDDQRAVRDMAAQGVVQRRAASGNRTRRSGSWSEP